MYELHGWIRLCSGSDDEFDLCTRINSLRERADRLSWSEDGIRLIRLNTGTSMTLHVHGNHAEAYVREVEALLHFVATIFPEAEGLCYELEEQTVISTGVSLYRVAVIQDGQVHKRLDPFLSPVS